MGLYQNFPYTNLHELNLDWLIEQLNKISSSSVLSVNGQTGQVILYENATVQFPNIPENNWTIVRMADGTTRGIYFGADDKAYIVHGATLEAVYSANNQPPYPVTRVNGQTGDITLYQEQFVQLPSLSDINMHNWTLFRNLNNMAEGIQFGEDGSAYIIHGTQRYLIYTTHDAPQGVVESVNGLSGTVVLFTDSQGDITFPAYSNPDFAGWILKRNINGTVLGIGFNEDGTLEFKCGGASYKIYTANDTPDSYVTDPTTALQEVTEDSPSDYWGLLRTTTEGQVGIIFENTNPDNPSVYLAYTDSNDQQQSVQLVTLNDIPQSSVISINSKSGIVTLYGSDIQVSSSDSRTIDQAIENIKQVLCYVENTDIAVHNIAVGDYVLWKNSLYTCSNAITAGDTLSASNLDPSSSTVFDEINQLKTGIGTIAIKKGPIYSPSSINFNLLMKDSICEVNVGQSVTNGPTGAAFYGVVETISVGTGARFCIQKAYRISNGVLVGLYYRCLYWDTSTWSPWKQVTLT